MLDASKRFFVETIRSKYSYNFEWLGRPIIQYPQDIVAVQEVIWEVKPDLIIETGIAHGGSVIFNASMLALLDMCDAISSGESFDPAAPKRKVLGVDIDIRSHNKEAIEQHPMFSRIQMIQGSSVAPDIVREIHNVASQFKRILVLLDSNHTHDHVLQELEAYSPLVSMGSYCIVFDTCIDDLPKDFFQDRLWGPGNNPRTALKAFLASHKEFEIDEALGGKLLLTVCPDGYLKRVS